MGTFQDAQIKIAPSILAADFSCLGEQISEVEAHGADMIHIDVMDGRFVPNITMGPLVVEAVRRVTDLPLDVHLMIVEPEKHIDAFARAGANNITIHMEATPNVHRALMQIHSHRVTAGIAINPHTPATTLIDLMYMVDVINVMTVNPGFGGQSFITEMKSKIARIRAMIGDSTRYIDLQVDGGIDASTAMDAAQAGANVLITGSAIFKHEKGIDAAMTELSSALER